MLPFELTKDTPYLALSGELWSVFMSTSTEIDRVIKGFYCMTVTMFQQTFSKAFSIKKMYVSIPISPKFVSGGLIVNESVLV